jgi:hypothetical protein
VDFDRVRSLVPITSLLAHCSVLDNMKRVGGQLRGPCPIHDGSNEQQFVVNVRSNTWYCFGDCERGGGTLELVSARERVSIPRAAELIAQWFSLNLSPSNNATSSSRKPMNGRPSHRAYVVEDREGDQNEQGRFWTRIGSAWPHKDGKGLNIVLSALPTNGRIVLREYTDEDIKAEEGKRKPAKK